MKKALSPKRPKKPARHRVNTYVDKELALVFQRYCAANRKARSVSHQVEEAMIGIISRHGKRYGLSLPAHLANGA